MKLIDDLKRNDIVLPEGKDKTVYMVLAILFGGIGVHNLWAGIEKGKAQLIVGLVGFFCCCLGPLVVWITAIMDILAVNKQK